MTTKRILVTGAGTGIGRDAVLALMKRGHDVIATTHSEEQATSLQSALSDGSTAFKLDITDPMDREKIRDLEIDVLINNAAIGDSGSLAEIDIDRVRTIFEVNLFSTLALSQIALRGMIARGSGTVIFISSLAGRVPAPFLMPYAMTKFALSAAAAGLRDEMALLNKGVQVCVVEPGAIHTGFNQKMMAKKYTWMDESSIFSREQIEKLKKDEERNFKWLEVKSTGSIVRKIVEAAESERPRLRYVAPWIHGFFIRLARILGY